MQWQLDCQQLTTERKALSLNSQLPCNMCQCVITQHSGQIVNVLCIVIEGTSSSNQRRCPVLYVTVPVC